MRNLEKVKQKLRERKKKRLRAKVYGTPERPRLVVYRGNKNMLAQLVDDVNNKTLGTISSTAKSYDSLKKSENGKIPICRQIGKDIAKTAQNLKISQVVFDRNGFKYHGRVKALAEGARKGGLKF